jgi:hypothetical protein
MEMSREAQHLEELAETLWQERHLTELLLYRLVCTRLLLASDDERFTALAISEVEAVTDALRDAEQRRDEVVQALAVSWGTTIDELKLARLAEHAPQPWASIFDDHRRAFLELTGEIETAAADNRRLAASNLHRVHQTMSTLLGTTSSSTYDTNGQRQPASPTPAMLDRVM